MAAIESLLDREVVSELVENSHRTFKEISEVLQAEFPNKRGLSVKSLKRYYHMHEIKRRQNVADNELDEVVKSAVEQGPCGFRPFDFYSKLKIENQKFTIVIFNV